MMEKCILCLAICCLLLSAFGSMGNAAVPALNKYPGLNDFFPYGFWFADGCYTADYCRNMPELYDARLEKILHDMARHYVNTMMPSNRVVYKAYLDTMAKYGQKSFSSRNIVPSLMSSHTENLDSKQYEQALEQWSAHIPQVKDHPSLLAWHVIDEPHPIVSPTIQKIKSDIYRIDPTHPVTYTHQNLPIHYSPSEIELVKSMDVILSDCYSLNDTFGYDLWLYGDVAMSEFRNLSPNALCWPIIQSFDYGKLPTLPELRVMIYHTIGCGAKGMFFFTTEQSGFTWEAPNFLPMYSGPGNAWFAEDELLGEIGRIGYYLTSAGPLLLPLDYKPKYKCNVETPEFTVKIEPKTIKLRTVTNLTMPAVHVGAFTGADYDVLVVHNDDPANTRSAKITLPASYSKKKIYDLYDMKEVPCSVDDDGVTFSVKFEPGDGKLYFFGNSGSYATAKQSVFRHRYQRNALLIGLDKQIAQAGGVDIAQVDKELAKADDLAMQHRYVNALNSTQKAAKLLQKAERKAPEYFKLKTGLESLRSSFTKLDDYFKTRKPKDIPVEWKTTMLGLTKRFGDMENEFRSGKINQQECDSLTSDLAVFKKTVDSGK